MLGGGAKWCGGGAPFTVVATCYRCSRSPGPIDIGAVYEEVYTQMSIGKSYCICETIHDVNRTKRDEAMRALDIPHLSALLDSNF